MASSAILSWKRATCLLSRIHGGSNIKIQCLNTFKCKSHQGHSSSYWRNHHCTKSHCVKQWFLDLYVCPIRWSSFAEEKNLNTKKSLSEGSAASPQYCADILFQGLLKLEGRGICHWYLISCNSYTDIRNAVLKSSYALSVTATSRALWRFDSHALGHVGLLPTKFTQWVKNGG